MHTQLQVLITTHCRPARPYSRNRSRATKLSGEFSRHVTKWCILPTLSHWVGSSTSRELLSPQPVSNWEGGGTRVPTMRPRPTPHTQVIPAGCQRKGEGRTSTYRRQMGGLIRAREGRGPQATRRKSRQAGSGEGGGARGRSSGTNTHRRAEKKKKEKEKNILISLSLELSILIHEQTKLFKNYPTGLCLGETFTAQQER